jgi:hypothetical protein
MPKLASEHAGTEEETMGAALVSQQEVLFVFVKGEYLYRSRQVKLFKNKTLLLAVWEY